MIVKNGEKFIKQALESIFNQDYRPIEIIVVLGNSTDRTSEILKEYGDIRIIQQEGQGVADAYNIGIQAAKGDFVAFLSSDDLWTSDKLSVQSEYLMKNPSVSFVNCFIDYFLEPGIAIPYGFRKELLTGSHPARIMETLFARKTVFEVIGFFNNKLSTAEDVDWYCRAVDLKINSFIIPEVLLKKRIHNQNISMKVDENTKNLMFALKESVKRKKT